MQLSVYVFLKEECSEADSKAKEEEDEEDGRKEEEEMVCTMV